MRGSEGSYKFLDDSTIFLHKFACVKYGFCYKINLYFVKI